MKKIINNILALMVRICTRCMERVYIRALCAFVVVAMIIAPVMSSRTYAAFNPEINYQGKLTLPSNVAVADGTYHMLFKLYTAPTGGSPVWSEDRSTAAGDRVTVTNGLFSVMLGSSTPLTDVDFNQTLYLGVEVGGAAGAPSFDGEMTPRKILGVVPAAFVADTVDSLSSEQFLRADAENATNTSSTFLTVTQNGTGHIADFFGESDIPVLTIASDGSIGIGTTTPNTLLDLGGNGGLSMNGGYGFGGGNILMDGGDIVNVGNLGIGTSSPYAKLSVVGQAVAAYFTATTSTASTLPYASTTALSVSGTGFFGTASTTNLTISSISSCSGSSALTTNSAGVVSCGAISAGAAYPFTPSTNFGSPVSATTSIIWAQSGIHASSTSQFLDVNISGTATADLVDAATYLIGGSLVFDKPANFRIGDFSDEGFGVEIWGGNEIVAIADSNGNFGIGTTSPAYKLSVEGESAFYRSIHVLGAGSEPIGQVTLSADIAPGAEGGLYDLNDQPVAVINNQLGYYQFAKRALSISETTGNAALGTSTPTSKLTVWGNGSGSNMLANFVNAASSTVLGLFENGNVGIGTTTLSGNALLNLYKQDDYSLTLSNQGTFTTALRFENDGVNVAEIEVDAGVHQFEIAAPTDYTIQFRTSGAIVGEIDSSGNWEFQKGNVTSVLGNIGAGTSSPYAQLSASSTDRVTGVFDQRGSSDILQLQKDGASLFNFTSTGRLGVGTTSPSAALAIQGAGYISSGLFVGGNITSTSSVASILPYASTTGLSVSGTGFFGTASTTNLTISSISSCSGSSALTTNSSGVVSCGAIAGSGGSFPFTPATHFGVNTSATTTALWAQAGLYASSTSQFDYATATALTIRGGLFDSTGSAGTNGMVLQTTGSVTQWVATSTLGFGPTGGGPSLIGAGGNGVTLTLNQFCTMIGSISCSSTQGFRESAVAASGTIGNFTVRTQAANGASATILTLNKNGSSCGTPSAVTVTIPLGGSATTVTDSTNTCDVAPGDRISVAVTGGTTAAGVVNSIMASFQPAAGIAAGSIASGSSGQFSYYNAAGTTLAGQSSLYYSGGNVGVGTTTPGSLFAVQGNGYVSSNLFVGGTITSTSSAASTFPYASTTALSVSGTGFFGTASTTNLTISSISSCSGSSALTTNSAGVVSCGAIAGSGGSFPFTPATNYGVNTSATSTALWAQAGIYASSTSHFADADFVNSTTTSSAYFPGGVWNASGNVGIGTTSPYAKLSVVGQVVASYFTSTSTTATSTFENGIKLGNGKSGLYGFSNDSLVLSGNAGTFNTLFFGGVTGEFPGILANTGNGANVPTIRIIQPDGTGNTLGLGNLLTGGFGTTLVSTTSSSGITTGQFTILADATGGEIINYLPTGEENAGQMFVVQKTDASANAVRIQDINTLVDVTTLTRQGDTVLMQADPITQLYTPLFDSSKYGMLAQTNTWTGANTFNGVTTIPYASSTAFSISGTGYFGTASTTNLTISSISSCSGSSALTTNSSGVVSCGAIAGSGGSFPFTPATHFGVNTSATTTALWAQAGLYASSTSQFDYATATALTVTGDAYMPGNGIWNSSGAVGIGLNTLPSAGTMLHVFSGSSGQATPFTGGDDFVIEGASSNTGLSILNSSTRIGGIYFGDESDADVGSIRYLHSLDSMDFVVNGAVAQTISSTGNVGIGTTSPYAKLSVVGEVVAEYFTATSSTATSTFAGRMIVGSGVLAPSSILAIASSSASYLQATIQNTNNGNAASSDWIATNDLGNDTKYYVDMGINSSTYNVAGFSIVGANDAYLYSSDSNLAIGTASTTGPANLIFHTAGTTAANERMRITSTGLVGIGTTTPWAKLSVVGGTNASSPSFVVATTSAWGDGQRPLLFVSATTTGKLDYARVAIGTTSPWGSAGLRDQFTVDGRIYSTWRYLSCDIGGSGGGAWSSDAAGACGDFAFDFDTDGTARLTRQAYPPAIELRAGSTNATVGDGSMLTTSVLTGSATTSPIMEAWVQASVPNGATSTPLFVVGMTNAAFGSDLGAMPTQGAYFIATTTPNWKIVTRSANNVETMTDSGFATSTTEFRKMRIELTTTEATFMVNGNVIAVHNTNLPTATLHPVTQVGVLASSGSSGSTPSLFVSLVRYWMDDPPGSLVSPMLASIAGEEEGGVASLGQEDIDTYNSISAAAVTAPYLVGNPAQFVEGSVVSFHEEDTARVRLSTKKYDPNTFGVVGMTSVQNLGETNDHTVNIALSGRVPVRVSLENGDIQPGDYLTASSIAGVAMKATASGPVLGRAMQVYDEDTAEYTEMVMMVVEPGYYSGDVLVQDAFGNVGIGTTSPSFKLTVSGDVSGYGFSARSDRDTLSSISTLTEEDFDSYLEKIKGTTISTYRYEDEDVSSPLRLGIVADDAPSEILSVSGEDVDVYKLAVFTLGGVKALENKFDILDARVSALESHVFGSASSTNATSSSVVNSESLISALLSQFESMGASIAQGVAQFKHIIVDRLTVGSSEKPTGITLYDEVTGEPYCLKVVSGKMKSVAGECGDGAHGENEYEEGGGNGNAGSNGDNEEQAIDREILTTEERPTDVSESAEGEVAGAQDTENVDVPENEGSAEDAGGESEESSDNGQNDDGGESGASSGDIGA